MRRNLVVFVLVGVLVGALAQETRAQVGRGAFGFGLSLNGNMLQSDWKIGDPGIGGAVDLSYSLGGNWGLVSRLGFDVFYGKNATNNTVRSNTVAADFALSYDLMRDRLIDPFIFVGGGVTFFSPSLWPGTALLDSRTRPWDFTVHGGVGFDFYLKESWSIMVTAEAGMVAVDMLDGYKGGSTNDSFGRVSLGLRYYLFDRSTVEKIVESARGR